MRIRVLKSHTINESKLFSVDFLSFDKFQIVLTDHLMCIKNLTMFIPSTKKISSSQPYFRLSKERGKKAGDLPKLHPLPALTY